MGDIYSRKNKNIYKDSVLPGHPGSAGHTPVDIMAEKQIVAAIMRHLKTVPDCFCFKEHGGMYGTAGLPDIICCISGRFVAFEVKQPSGNLTKLQEATIQRIKDAKGKAYKVSSVEEVKSILANLEV